MRVQTIELTALNIDQLTKPHGLYSDAARRFVRNKLALVGLVLVGILIFLALAAPFIAPTGYDVINPIDAWQFPSNRHWLGTDSLGRDFLSRIIYGARTSLLVGIFSQVIAVAIGMPLGALAGWKGGKVDFIITRLIDVFSALPWYLLAILIVSVIGNGLQNVLAALGITVWIVPCRLVRGQVLSLREKDFVLAARALGAKEGWILVHHILPNCLTPVIVAIALGIPNAIFGEAGLSFLGMGVAPPMPSWGQMVGESLQYIQYYWHLALVPALMIALTMLGFTFIGDGLRDAFDPTMKI
jgi:ABC-type dipeptide/oligopeptide/nickel transport system permease subunit